MERPRYPVELVHRYGAKAGVLLYVAQHLPEIPQAKMVVNEPGESTEDFANRVRVFKHLEYPTVLIRSSAVEELDGFEGVFPTKAVHGGWDLEETISLVKNSPRELKTSGKLPHDFPDEISVIAAEKSPSRFAGTMVKHPNQDRIFMLTITDSGTININYPEQGARRRCSAIYNADSQQVSHFGRGTLPVPIEELLDEIGIVAGWHDRINHLPEMDPNWTYQMEFGVDPLCLYQFRLFKPIKIADFTLPPIKNTTGLTDIVIGATDRTGINLLPKRWHKPFVYADYYIAEEEFRASPLPILVCTDLRDCAWLAEIATIKGYFLDQAAGFLAHSDISAIRASEIAVLSSSFVPWEYAVVENQPVNIVSDGKTLQITPAVIPKPGMG